MKFNFENKPEHTPTQETPKNVLEKYMDTRPGEDKPVEMLVDTEKPILTQELQDFEGTMPTYNNPGVSDEAMELREKIEGGDILKSRGLDSSVFNDFRKENMMPQSNTSEAEKAHNNYGIGRTTEENQKRLNELIQQERNQANLN